MTLYERLLAAGIPRDEIYHHESDLYVALTPLTQAVVHKWCKDIGIQDNDWNIRTFRDQQTGKPMFDIPFQYDPWWEERGIKNNG